MWPRHRPIVHVLLLILTFAYFIAIFAWLAVLVP